MADDDVEKDDLVLVATTDKALLVREHGVDEDDAEDGETQWWVPRSQITGTDLQKIGDVGYVEVTAWWASKNDWD